MNEVSEKKTPYEKLKELVEEKLPALTMEIMKENSASDTKKIRASRYLSDAASQLDQAVKILAPE